MSAERRASPKVLLDLRIPSEPSMLPAVRRATREALEHIDVTNDAELVVSELVSNAMKHGECPCDVRLIASDHCLRIEVDDLSPTEPQLGPRLDSNLDDAGRGLRMVQAVSESFGSVPAAEGKTVWAELRI